MVPSIKGTLLIIKQTAKGSFSISMAINTLVNGRKTELTVKESALGAMGSHMRASGGMIFSME
jgi:hypothetical protein